MAESSTLDPTFGAILIGVVVSAILYGMTNIQTYLYFTRYPNDTERLRAFVGVIWMLDTFHVALILKATYHYLITNFANPLELIDGHWSLFTSVAVNLVISLMVQAFFTVQIFHLCSKRSRWAVTLGITFLILAHFAFGIETVTLLFIKKQLSRLPEITLIAATPLAVFAVLSDVAIAAGLCILLHGSRSVFSQTNALITTLIAYAINRCLLTSIVAIIEVLVLIIAPHSLWFLAVDFAIGELWANSMLASLNSRRALRRGSMIHSMNTIGISQMQFSEQRSGTPEAQGNSLQGYQNKRVSDITSNASSHLEIGGIESRPPNYAAKGESSLKPNS